MKQKGILFKLFVIKVLVIVMASCSSIPTQRERTIEEVMDKTITHIYSSMSEDEINAMDYDHAMRLFDDDDLEVLSRRHWVFDVNVPAKVFLMRSKKQERIPFWIESAGFSKTGLEMENNMHTYEVWEKIVEPGTVELGINGFENFTYHYFVAVAPLNETDRLDLSIAIPENKFIGTLENGAFTYHDWTELVLRNVPDEMVGYKLLTTTRGRGKESHLIGAFRKTIFPSSPEPDQIMLTWSSDPSSSVDIQWRTDSTVETGEVYYRMKGSSEVQSTQAEKYILEDRELMNDRYIHRFTANLKNLDEGTTYEYIVGSDMDWEKAYTFSTAASDESFSFIWFGDVHNKPEFGQLHQSAEEKHPDAAFYIIAGDLVDDGLYRDQWDKLFKYSENVIPYKPLMNVPGNHDNRMGLGAKMYRDMFSYPTNGPDEVPDEQTYSFTYKNALFLMLDATSGVHGQTEWIRQQLSESDATWKFAVFHFPPYSSREPYVNIQKEWVPLFDEFHVDMVFSGHFHYYMRSFPINNEQVVDSFDDGTVYIISLGIPGREGSMPDEPYAAVRNQKGSQYQYLRINGNNLIFNSFDFEGKLVDEFTINKGRLR